MNERKTSGMAYASIIRVIGIYAAAQILFTLQWLSHTSAAFILILGFVVEAYFARRAVYRIEKTNKMRKLG